MAKFERSREKRGNRDFKYSPPKRDGGNRDFEERPFRSPNRADRRGSTRDDRGRSGFGEGPSRDRRSFGDRSMGRRDFGRDSGRGGRSGRDFEITKVTCSSCGTKCEVPFKPSSAKPVYCNDCFGKKDKPVSGKDIELINEKLDKIMKALNIK